MIFDQLLTNIFLFWLKIKKKQKIFESPPYEHKSVILKTSTKRNYDDKTLLNFVANFTINQIFNIRIGIT